MARRKISTPTTPQARDLALAVRQGERRGLSQREIAATLGINPRTVRKIKSGQTSGTKTYRRLTTTPRGVRATPNAFNAEFTVGYDRDGNPIIGSANIIIPDVRTRAGGRRAPTALDVFRLPDLQAVADAERAAMARRYEATIDPNRSATACRRSYCGHDDDKHDERNDDGKQPCSLCQCPNYLGATVKLRSIGTMRKRAHILRGRST
jgi:transcriptional regulator with XRE-family HTH domain